MREDSHLKSPIYQDFKGFFAQRVFHSGFLCLSLFNPFHPFWIDRFLARVRVGGWCFSVTHGTYGRHLPLLAMPTLSNILVLTIFAGEGVHGSSGSSGFRDVVPFRPCYETLG